MAEDNKKYIELTSEFEDFYGEPVSLRVRFSKPTSGQVQRMQAETPKSIYRASRNFLLRLVDPEQKEEFIAAMDEYSGIADTFTTEILRREGWGSLGK